jgi:hypothetical protein
VSDLGRGIRRTPGAVKAMQQPPCTCHPLFVGMQINCPRHSVAERALVLRAGERIEMPVEELLPGGLWRPRRPKMAFTVEDVDPAASSITIGGAPRTPQPARLPGDATG